MKINDLKCSASLEHGLLTLDDGSIIDLHEVYSVLSELREYAENATLGEDALPQCAFDADRLLAEFS